MNKVEMYSTLKFEILSMSDFGVNQLAGVKFSCFLRRPLPASGQIFCFKYRTEYKPVT